MSHCDGLMQKRRNSSALAMELCLICIKPSICYQFYVLTDCSHSALNFMTFKRFWNWKTMIIFIRGNILHSVAYDTSFLELFFNCILCIHVYTYTSLISATIIAQIRYRIFLSFYAKNCMFQSLIDKCTVIAIKYNGDSFVVFSAV